MNIKAYVWDDKYHGESHVVWAATPGKAKALLAAEHDREFTEMRVSRVPWADKYGDSKRIPAMGLPDETQVYKINDYADLDHSDGCPLLGVIVVNEPDSKPVIYLR